MDTAASARPPKPGFFEHTRARLFYSPGATLVTLAVAALLLWASWRAFGWGVLHAVAAPDFAACKAAEHGACWGFVAEKWRLILFGRYPYEQQWRPALATGAVLAMLVASALPALWSRRSKRWCGDWKNRHWSRKAGMQRVGSVPRCTRRCLARVQRTFQSHL